LGNLIQMQKETVGLNKGTRGQLAGPEVVGGSVLDPPIDTPPLDTVGIDKTVPSGHARRRGYLDR
jgi:hypothetical protein